MGMPEAMRNAIRARLRDKMAANEEARRRRSTGFFKPHPIKEKGDEGDEIRLISPSYLDGEGWLTTQVYKIPMEGREYPQVVGVPSLFGLPDPVADLQKDLSQSGAEEREFAKHLYPREAYFALVVDVNDPDSGVQIWEFGPKVHDQIAEIATTRGYSIPWDAEDGHNLIVKRYGKGKNNTTYSVMALPERTSLDPELAAAAERVDLAMCVNRRLETYETLLEILDGNYDAEAAKERRLAYEREHGFVLAPFVGVADSVSEKPTESKMEPQPKPEPEQPKTRKRGRPRKQAEPEKPKTPVFAAGSRVSFECDGETMEGVILGESDNPKAPGEFVVQAGEEEFDIPPELLTLVQPKAEPEPEPEKPKRRSLSAAKPKPETESGGEDNDIPYPEGKKPESPADSGSGDLAKKRAELLARIKGSKLGKD